MWSSCLWEILGNWTQARKPSSWNRCDRLPIYDSSRRRTKTYSRDLCKMLQPLPDIADTFVCEWERQSLCCREQFSTIKSPKQNAHWKVFSQKKNLLSWCCVFSPVLFFKFSFYVFQNCESFAEKRKTVFHRWPIQIILQSLPPGGLNSSCVRGTSQRDITPTELCPDQCFSCFPCNASCVLAHPNWLLWIRWDAERCFSQQGPYLNRFHTQTCLLPSSMLGRLCVKASKIPGGTTEQYWENSLDCSTFSFPA